MEFAQKVKEDWLEWSESQKLEDESDSELVNAELGVSVEQVPSESLGIKLWKAPPLNWFKCNVGTSWSKRNKLAGCAWVLRDHAGLVLLHSRRAFSLVKDKFEAQVKSLMWAIDSMRSHCVDKVIFALQDEVMVKVITKPTA